MFPDGLAGVARVLLRASAAFSLVAAILNRPDLPVWSVALLGLVIFALIFGVFTRWAAAISALVGVAGYLFFSGDMVVCALLNGLNMSALAILGAGAYSADALLFGRRVINLKR